MAASYEIRVRGHLPLHWSAWLEGCTITHHVGGETVLAGSLRDQAALFGLLVKLRDLGVTLLSVNQIVICSARHHQSRLGRSTMALLRMDNVLIVVDDLEAAKAFFLELGLELEGETTVEGPSVDRLIGLEGVRATLVLLRTPDGHGRIELDKFHTPQASRTGPANAPVNELGIRRIMFAVDDIDDVVARLRARGAELIGDVVQYEEMVRLAYVRGPEGIIVGLAEQLG
jgi:catechol 2,3-dioxygenase-like lactoylglutathione lyase family enzyme